MGTWATLVILSRSRVREAVAALRSSFVPQVLPVTENFETTRQESVLVTSAPLHDALHCKGHHSAVNTWPWPFHVSMRLPSFGSAALSLSGPCPNNRSLPFRPSWLCGDPSRQDPPEQLVTSRQNGSPCLVPSQLSEHERLF